jgi:hypothetical protein
MSTAVPLSAPALSERTREELVAMHARVRSRAKDIESLDAIDKALLDAIQYEIDSLDAAELMKKPADAVPWDEAQKLLDLE